jgi:hypothetical protein
MISAKQEKRTAGVNGQGNSGHKLQPLFWPATSLKNLNLDVYGKEFWVSSGGRSGNNFLTCLNGWRIWCQAQVWKVKY